MPFYTIRHLTRTRYSASVRENVTELRMQPRSIGNQRCLRFDVHTTPAARVGSFVDHYGNTIHHFDVPAPHRVLEVAVESLVEVVAPPALPDTLEADAWEQLAEISRSGSMWDWLHPSTFARPTAQLEQLCAQLGLPTGNSSPGGMAARHEADPLSMVLTVNHAIYSAFDYAPQTTRVDSPIDEAISERRGVCQDFAHIMIAVLRGTGIPCRYVSGYLFHRRQDHDRSAEDATHAWVEAWLPGLEWVGFDPTNDLVIGERHILVAVGRDYADVPPNRGIFKGAAEERMRVGVHVGLADAPPEPDETILPQEPPAPDDDLDSDRAQMMQQQQ